MPEFQQTLMLGTLYACTLRARTKGQLEPGSVVCHSKGGSQPWGHLKLDRGGHAMRWKRSTLTRGCAELLLLKQRTGCP
eukprot:scaffold52120_cov15-Tisochrysis_lutea.AAC.1